MSITIRTYTTKELNDIKNNKDPFKTTIFMNGSTFSAEEIKAYPHALKKTYILDIHNSIEGDIKINATDDINAKNFIRAEYNLGHKADYTLLEELKTYREVV